MDRRLALLALPALAAVVWYVWEFEGKAHNVEVEPLSVAPSYSPWDHWAGSMPGGYVRHFPARIGPAVLGEVYANEDQGALSTSGAAPSSMEEYSSG